MTKSRLVGFILIGLAAEILVVIAVVGAFKYGLEPLGVLNIALGVFIAVVADITAAKEIRRRRSTSFEQDENPEYEDETRDYEDECGFCNCDSCCDDEEDDCGHCCNACTSPCNSNDPNGSCDR